jgi:hypothetical protein
MGYGYWGPNLARNFSVANGSQVVMICDMNEQIFNKAKKSYPHIKVTKNCDEMIYDPEVDAVAIATPVFTHFEIAKKVLEAGKSVFVEKPFTSTIAQAEELIELAEKKNLKIMVDHTFLYTGAVNKIKELIANDILGDIYYFDSIRVNLGLFQHDINVVWDLVLAGSPSAGGRSIGSDAVNFRSGRSAKAGSREGNGANRRRRRSDWDIRLRCGWSGRNQGSDGGDRHWGCMVPGRLSPAAAA